MFPVLLRVSPIHFTVQLHPCTIFYGAIIPALTSGISGAEWKLGDKKGFVNGRFELF